MSALRDLFGEEFAKRYLEAIRQSQRLSEQRINEIIEAGIKAIRDTGKWHVKCNKYDVILCQIPQAPKVKRVSSGNFKVGLIWPSEENIAGPWISAFFSREEDAKAIADRPGSFVIIVGRLRQREDLVSISVLGYRILEETEVPQVEVPTRRPPSLDEENPYEVM